MEKTKKTIGGFIKEHKSKIIKGVLIVTGVTAGVLVYKKLTAPDEKLLLEGEKIIEAFNSPAVSEIVEVAEETIKVVE